MPLPFINDPVAGEAARAGLDFFGVDPSLVTDTLGGDFAQVPRTRTRTSHGLLIRVAGGRIIGAVHQFQHRQDRDIRDIFEVEANARGYGPADILPGNQTARTLSISRYDLWQRPIEEAFGTGFEYVNLADQARPFVLRTIWRSPVNPLLGGRRVYEYTGCYFRSFGRTAAATDNRVVNVQAEIVYVQRKRVS